MFLWESADVLSRIIFLVFGLLIWAMYYLNARYTYRLQVGPGKTKTQLVLLLGSVGIFVLQVSLLGRLVPGSVFGDKLKGLVLIDAGGALVVGLSTLLWERARSMRASAMEDDGNDAEL